MEAHMTIKVNTSKILINGLIVDGSTHDTRLDLAATSTAVAIVLPVRHTDERAPLLRPALPLLLSLRRRRTGSATVIAAVAAAAVLLPNHGIGVTTTRAPADAGTRDVVAGHQALLQFLQLAVVAAALADWHVAAVVLLAPGSAVASGDHSGYITSRCRGGGVALAVAVAAAAGFGQLLGASDLDVPVGGSHRARHPDGARGLRRQEAEPQAGEAEAGAECQRHTHRHAHQVEGGEVDARAAGRAGAAAEHAAAGRLRAVSELAEPRDGERHGREAEDVRVRREHAAPVGAHGHHEGGGRQAHAHADGEGGARGAPRPRGAARAQLVADARGRALAQRRREHVDERRGLDEDAHGRHGGARVGQEARQHDHELVPPPLQAHRRGGGHRQAEHLRPAPEAVQGGPHPRVPVRARDGEEAEEREEQVEVGERHGQRHPGDAHLEAHHEEVVDGPVQQHGEEGARRDGQRQVLRPEVDAQRVQHGQHREVGRRVRGERLRRVRHALVLAQQLEHVTRGGDPQRGDRQRHGEEQQHGAVQRQRQQLAPARAEGLAADGLHAERQTGENGVAGDVGEAKRQGAAGQRQLA